MISGKALKARGWAEGRLLGLAKKAGALLLASEPGGDRERALDLLDAVRADPARFQGHAVLGDLAAALLTERQAASSRGADDLRAAALPYDVWGAGGIDQAARAQMEMALRLPISVAGALMPDAHTGYGLPIGGVLAAVDAVIPYAVGSDIACRMRLSVYEVDPRALDDAGQSAHLTCVLVENTAFGPGAIWRGRQRADHAVLEDPAWRETRLLASLRERAAAQLATSGSGNHFVEWGILTLSVSDPAIGLLPGRYLSLLSHSGSRGVGFKIADTYTRLAEAAHPTLPKEARRLAWLSLSSAEGRSIGTLWSWPDALPRPTTR